MRLRLLFVFTAVSLLPVAQAETASAARSPEAMLQEIYAEALARGEAYRLLEELTRNYPGRLSGSKNLSGAVVWAERTLNHLALDRVYKQDVQVPHWERGPKESVRLLPTKGRREALAALALGGSVPSPRSGITAAVIEVSSLSELAALGQEKIAGKIVFFNRPMDPAVVSPGLAYGAAGDQRNRGPSVAARLGAVGALVRSLTHARDDVPHTGVTTYAPDGPKIPAAALSTFAADKLSSALDADPELRVELKIHSRLLPPAPSHNVIGEIRGSVVPERIILVGGHLDSWDISPGAHDDGAGVVQSIEVLRLFRALGIKPRHTLRCVLFTSEENSSNGATVYATSAKASGEQHLFAVESDNGGFQPRGFNLGSTQGDAHVRAAQRWRHLFEPYGIYNFQKGTGGVDVGPLLLQGVTVAGLTPDSQRYFDYHHTARDTIEHVHPRELHLGAAALAALIWLVDTQGL